MLPDQAHAPGQGLAPAAGHPGVDQGVEGRSLVHAQPGHHRHAGRGERDVVRPASHRPGDLALELQLGLGRDAHALFAGVVAERHHRASGSPGRGPLRRPTAERARPALRSPGSRRGPPTGARDPRTNRRGSVSRTIPRGDSAAPRLRDYLDGLRRLPTGRSHPWPVRTTRRPWTGAFGSFATIPRRETHRSRTVADGRHDGCDRASTDDPAHRCPRAARAGRVRPWMT